MERLDGSSTIPPRYRGGIIALGNFDGFHLGHQAVVGRAVARARAEGRPALVGTFDPHPKRYFQPESEWFRLTTLEQRERLLAQAGVDAVVVFRFDAALAALNARQYAERLAQEIGVSGVVTGDDFTFGSARSGDVRTLAQLGQELGFTAETVAPVLLDGAIISSSRIRASLQAAAPRDATALLSRPFRIEAVVEKGAQLGRTLDFPTANMRLNKYVRPTYGIYAVRGHLPDGRILDGVANLGIRPSFDPPIELLESFFFDFSEDLYGQTLEVSLIDYIRPEAKFDSLSALKAQMDQDAITAKAVLAQYSES